MERIGIDTHGYDQPIEDDWGDECEDEIEDRLGEIVDEIDDLVGDYKNLSSDYPYISGYTRERPMDNATGLRVCPFCKCKKMEARQKEQGIYFVCLNKNCGATGPVRQSTLMAKAAWNAD